MAGDWIKMRTDLATSPKVVRISSALRADRFRTVGALHAVWCLFDAHSLDGKLEGYNLGTVDDLIGFTGFAEAMASVGWLVESAGSLELPRFDDHNGSSAKRRAMESDRKRKGRLSASDADVDADELRTREEKRREEVNQDQKHVSPPSADDQPAKKKSAFDPLTTKPPNVSAKVWADFVAHRKGKSKLTAVACELIAAKLAGHPDPDAVLNQSIENGWTGIFPEKVHAASKQPGGQGFNSAVDQVKRAIAEREARSAQAESNNDRQALAEDDGDLRPPLDVEFRRVG